MEPLAADVLRLCGDEPFELAIILGSGLGSLADLVENGLFFPYDDYACLRAPAISGHAGQLITGRLFGRRVLLFQGRLHLYQGFSAHEVSITVRLSHRLGCRKILLTNAAGGICDDYQPGDFMYIADHLNFMGDNPLRGAGGDPFVDLSTLYNQQPYPALSAWSESHGVRLHRGVLAALKGPSYETPAEVRALARLGGDAVSMSTVPEAIMACSLGFDVVGISLIANCAAGMSSEPLNHQEVLDIGRRSAERFTALTSFLVPLWCSALPK